MGESHSAIDKSPVANTTARSCIYALLVAVLAGVILFGNLHRGDLSGYDDAAYAHEAKQMLQTGRWWETRLNGRLDFDKPPVFVWLEATSMIVLGTTDLAAKFPSALLGLGVILLVYLLGREMTEEFWPPLIAMFLILTTQYFLKYATHAMTCVPFTFFFCLSLFYYLKGLKQPGYLILCGLAFGLSTLTRSPMGLIPLAIVISHLLSQRSYNVLRSKQMLLCILLAVLLPFVWYVSQYMQFGRRFLVEHLGNLGAHASSSPLSITSISLGLLQYPYLLLKHYWPWLPFAMLGFCIQLKRMLRERDAVACLLVLWVVMVLVPLSLAESKVLRYVMPIFPALSMTAGLFIDHLVPCRFKLVGYRLAYIGTCILAVSFLFFPSYRLRAEDMRKLAPIADAATSPEQRVLLYSFGERRWDYRNQLIWYGNRFCEQTEDLGQVSALLRRDPDAVVILDKAAVARLSTQIDLPLNTLGESDNFVCVQRQSRMNGRPGAAKGATR
jgi:4-amino-4-deoxy-L-arabinose transferase-like glycosyltransferase